MEKKAKYTTTLTIVSLLASIGVSSTFILTKNIIKEKEKAARTEALHTVLSGISGLPVKITPENASEQDHVYEGKDASGQLVGYAACGEAQGYSSKIKVMVGIDAGFKKVLGINVLAQNETPGLGTKMIEIQSASTLWSVLFGGNKKKLTGKASGNSQQLPLFQEHEGTETWGMEHNTKEAVRPWFQEQFKSRPFGKLVVSKVKDAEKITAITGATISSKAVVNAVQDAIEKIKNTVHPKEWEIQDWEMK
jgi:Na+-translocating ferredoxin:NAD+ oxidoreductase RnfG subunit